MADTVHRHPRFFWIDCSCFFGAAREATIPATASETLCTSGTFKSALVPTYADVESNHTQMAAALLYYFVMALCFQR